MNRRSKPPTKKSTAAKSKHRRKYLKPGALARIRDSLIFSAKHQKLNSLIDFSPRLPSPPPSPPSTAAPPPDAVPCFDGKIFGPRFPQRKKLAAVKYVSYITPSPPDSPSDSPDPIIDSLGNDTLVDN